ncbi:MAG: RlmE family RNA methyltransferase [Kofleriaceae bacterium]|nr:RlmE family RNA methyltransferase [Myxococcales bacterium]MCB9562734.1 RlmE family RNA methyltransferase [Kofleriaceae bacterium]MCB9571056.1 RlmE family RNA methyltransferase [Kofleriaceae bacterium]
MGRSKLGDRNVRRDRFHQRAQREGFRARAAFKLEELDRARPLFHRGGRVLDLGCAPGSWLQYAATRVGPEGHLVGIDRVEIPGIARARLLVGDIYDVTLDDLLGDLDAFDVVMSDMAPDTTGIRHVDQARSEGLFERALEIACDTLAPGGAFVGKLFQGPDFKTLIDRCRRRFGDVRTVKPESSRQFSIEQYVVARDFKAAARPGPAAARAEEE